MAGAGDVCAVSIQASKHRVANNVQKLGPELADRQFPCRTEPLFHRHHQRWPLRGFLQCRPFQLDQWPNLQWRPVPVEHFMRLYRSFLSVNWRGIV